ISLINIHKGASTPGGPIEGEVDMLVGNPMMPGMFPGSVFKISAIGDTFAMSDVHMYTAMFTTFTADGGGIHPESHVTLNHCTFGTPFSSQQGFHTIGNGGAIWATGAAVTITNCDFYNNSAANLGGAIFNIAGDTNSVIYLTVHGNSAADLSIFDE